MVPVDYYHLQSIGDYEEIVKQSSSMTSIEEKYWYIYAKFRQAQLEEAMQLVDEFDSTDEFWINKFKQLKGQLLIHQGHLEQAEICLIESFEFFKIHSPNSVHQADAYNNLGNLQMLRGDLIMAEFSFNSALRIYENLEDNAKASMVLGNIGLICRGLAEYDQAIEFFHRSIYGLEENGNSLPQANFIMQLIDTYIIVDQIELAKQHNQILQNLAKNSNNKRIVLFATYSDARIALKSGSFKGLAEAKEKFGEIIHSAEFRADLRLNSIEYLMQILVQEYRLFNSQEIFNQISELVDLLYSISRYESLHPKVIDAIIMQSKLLMVEGKYQGAKNLVDEARNIAESFNLIGMLIVVDREEELMNQALYEMKKLVSSNSNILTRFEQVNFMEYLDSLLEDKHLS